MKYPAVRNAHVVPECYLRNFARAGKQIETHRVGASGSETRPVKKVGVRPYQYRRTRPDGTKIDDIEWSLSKMEDKAAPLLREIETRWPLTTDERGLMASFAAAQVVRGPRWAAWYERQTHQQITELREKPDETDLTEGHDGPQTLDDIEAVLLSDTFRLRQMLEYARKLPAILGSMHWTLVEFRSPLIATSDHPVVLWPLNSGGRAPQATQPIGFINSLEVRLPVSPTATILMAWIDVADTAQPRVRGARHHAANINAFTVAEAERHWFHLPETTAPVASGRLAPLTPELVKGYSHAVARASQRRKTVKEIMDAQIGQPSKEWFEMVVAAQ
ncbi:MAG TPA: DUF4238 domain-containing protein [Gaiellaceae bacterium]|nr:DUF4238 domain-containing protein [Gaiellaceae bacterium]